MKRLSRIVRFRLDLWEILLLVALGFAVMHPFRRAIPTLDRELGPFRERYGPHHQSENQEEWFIRDFFADRRGGFFVDVGANHPKNYSKTWYLEKQLGWAGIAIDPLREFEAAYGIERPATRFRSLFVSDRSDQVANLYVIDDNTLVSSGDPAFTSTFGTSNRVETVPTITLTDLLVKEAVPHIDFVNIDIELHEPAALRGFDIGRFKPTLVCIEALPPVRQQILEFFARHGYVLVGKYLRVDTENLYFIQLDQE